VLPIIPPEENNRSFERQGAPFYRTPSLRKKQENLQFKGMEYQESADTAKVSYGVNMNVIPCPAGNRGQRGRNETGFRIPAIQLSADGV
jgi:hypothetical protein